MAGLTTTLNTPDKQRYKYRKYFYKYFESCHSIAYLPHLFSHAQYHDAPEQQNEAKARKLNSIIAATPQAWWGYSVDILTATMLRKYMLIAALMLCGVSGIDNNGETPPIWTACVWFGLDVFLFYTPRTAA